MSSRNIWGGEGCLGQKKQQGQRQCIEAERPVRLDLRSKDESAGDKPQDFILCSKQLTLT